MHTIYKYTTLLCRLQLSLEKCDVCCIRCGFYEDLLSMNCAMCGLSIFGVSLILVDSEPSAAAMLIFEFLLLQILQHLILLSLARISITIFFVQHFGIHFGNFFFRRCTLHRRRCDQCSQEQSSRYSKWMYRPTNRSRIAVESNFLASAAINNAWKPP